MKTEAEIGVTHLQAQEHHGLPKATCSQERGLGQILPQSLPKGPTLLTP